MPHSGLHIQALSVPPVLQPYVGELVSISNTGPDWVSSAYLPHIRSGIGFTLQGEMQAGTRVLPRLGSRTLFSQEGPLRFSPGLHNLSIRFRPGLGLVPDGMSASEFQQEKAAELGDLYPSEARQAAPSSSPDSLDFLLGVTAQLIQKGRLVSVARLFPLSGDHRKVRDWARQLGITERTLERRVLQYLGISPKEYLDLVRFRHILRQSETSPHEPLWGLGLDAGFYDQAHFIRVFQRYAGLSPARWQKQRGLSDFYNFRA